MRYAYAKFINYSRLYTGLGRTVVEIDFTRCRHNILLIAGKNGSGKSSLKQALSILPDDSAMYLQGKAASKELHFVDKEHSYIIHIESPVNNKGDRKKTIAHISMDGEELNPNGNVTSYKETIFNLFDLDANYITLSSLSSEDRGLASKRPAERKQYVSSIVDSVEVYNNMYKIFSKRASVLKSQLNGVESKIRSLGDPTSLNEQYRSLVVQVESKKDDIKNLILEKGKAESILERVDKDGTLQNRYKEIYDRLKVLKNQNDSLNIPDNIISLEEYDNLILQNDRCVQSSKDAISSIENTINSSIMNREEDLHLLDIKREKLKSFGSEKSIDELESIISRMKSSMSHTEEIMRRSNIEGIALSSQEYSFIFKTLESIENAVSTITSDCSISDLIYDASNIYTDKENAILEKGSIDLPSIKSTIKEYSLLVGRLSVLNDRPNDCVIDSCPFVSEALAIQSNNYPEKIQALEMEYKEKENRLSILEKEIMHYDYLINMNNQIAHILELANNDILSKIGFSFDREDIVQYAQGNHTKFDRYRDSIRNYTQYAYEMDQYINMKEALVKLEADYKIALNKEEVVQSMISEINDIELKLQSIEEDINTKNNMLEKEKSLLSTLLQKQDTLYRERDVLKIYNTNKQEMNNLKTEYDGIRNDISAIKEASSTRLTIEDRISREEDALYQLEQTKTRIHHDLDNLASYQKEYDELSTEFNLINILKNHSSPTGQGIQSFFMNLYMNKTLGLCNQILGMLFQGEYQLLPYEINEKEFRIPFMNRGFEIDDISSGSSSQVAMVGLIINLVLLYQASTGFNIAYLDEADGPLDNKNRSELAPVIDAIINILNIEQLIMISHSIELDMHNVDVILLQNYDGEEGKFAEANIIADFSN